MANLPATITRFDPAGIGPSEGPPQLHAIRAVTEDCDDAVLLGETTVKWDLKASEEWIQMDKDHVVEDFE